MVEPVTGLDPVRVRANLEGISEVAGPDVEILADGAALDAILARTGGQLHLADPWGTQVTLTPKAA